MRVIVVLAEVVEVVKVLVAPPAVRVARALGVVLDEPVGGREVAVAVVADVVHRRIFLVLP